MKSRGVLFLSIMLFCSFFGCASKTMYAVRKAAPKVYLDPQKHKILAIVPLSGPYGIEMTSALVNKLKEKTDLKVTTFESVGEGILKRAAGQKSFQKADLLLKGTYYEKINYASVDGAKDYEAAIVRGILDLELIDNQTGEILLRENYSHSEKTPNYSREFEPNTALTRAEASRGILASKFMENIMPSNKGNYYEAYIDGDYPDLENGHLLIMGDKFQEAVALFDAVLKKSPPSKIKGHALYGKSVAFAYAGDPEKAKESFDLAYRENPESGYLKFKWVINQVEHDAPILKRYR